MTGKNYTVIGATGGPGLGIFARLALRGERVTGLARRSAPIAALSGILAARGLDNARLLQADLSQPGGAEFEALSATTHLVGASRAPFVRLLATQMPHLRQILALGSTRVYTRFPDARMAEMQALEDWLKGQTVPWALIHPTMIYGATGYNNVERVRKLLKWVPLIPLPEGGKSLIQPVHSDDVVDAAINALEDSRFTGRIMILAGPQPVSYRGFIQAIARQMGKRVYICSLPTGLLQLGSWLTRWIPGLPKIGTDEVRRLLEDKDFDTTDTKALLGRSPLSLEKGLSRYYSMPDHFS